MKPILVVVCVVLLSGCKSESTANQRCGVTGQSAECACPGGLKGAQTCQADGTFSSCECPKDTHTATQFADSNGAEIPDGAKKDVAMIEMQKYSTEALFRWQRKNPDRSCPSSLDELSAYIGKKDAKDPWRNSYIMKCGDQAPPGKMMGVKSKGPDGEENTDDDITSWE